MTSLIDFLPPLLQIVYYLFWFLFQCMFCPLLFSPSYRTSPPFCSPAVGGEEELVEDKRAMK